MSEHNPETVKRAAFLMRVAARFIAENNAECGQIIYDEADCDGYCLMEELRGNAHALDGRDSE